MRGRAEHKRKKLGASRAVNIRWLVNIHAYKHTWNAKRFPACSPPLMTLKDGTGKTLGDGFPARSA